MGYAGASVNAGPAMLAAAYRDNGPPARVLRPRWVASQTYNLAEIAGVSHASSQAATTAQSLIVMVGAARNENWR
jgi:hypothetical protein